jgi:hypothetical protein
VNVELHQSFVPHLQQKGLADFLVQHVGAFHYLIDLKRLLSFQHFAGCWSNMSSSPLAQVQQTAACKAAHTVQARICKWLLRMHELVGVDLC